jgi:hypothetical protein
MEAKEDGDKTISARAPAQPARRRFLAAACSLAPSSAEAKMSESRKI